MSDASTGGAGANMISVYAFHFTNASSFGA